MITKLALKTVGLYLNGVCFVWPRVGAKQGFYLCCYPFRTVLRKNQKDFLKTSKSFTVEVDGVGVRGYRWGSGSKKVLFIHGWQSHSFRWKPYVESMSKDEYSIYAFDAPGHGLTAGNYLSVPFYSACILKFQEVIGDLDFIICHSIGCFAALHALYQHPVHQIRRLVLLAPPGEAMDFMHQFQSRLGLTDTSVNLVIKEFEDKFHVPFSHYSTSKFASELVIPGLIIHDIDDVDTPYTNALEIIKKWKHAQLITTKGLGHRLKSDKVVKSVLSYLHDGSIYSI